MFRFVTWHIFSHKLSTKQKLSSLKTDIHRCKTELNFQIQNIIKQPQPQSHLIGALELLQIKIKMTCQGTHSEERSEQERLVRCQSRTVGILLMLNLQFIKCTLTIRKRKILFTIIYLILLNLTLNHWSEFTGF